MLTLGGISLSPGVNPEIEAWVAARIPLRDFYAYERQAWPGKRLTFLTFPGFIPERPILLNRLYWPRGASRWATFFTLVDDNQLAALRVASQTWSQALTLSMSWEDAGAGQNQVAVITTKLWCLPALPLSRFGGANGLSLLCLVDDRFWWWYQSTGGYFVNDGGATWVQLYAYYGSRLGVTIAVDTVPAVYLTPSHLFSSSNESIPLLLDAAAYNCGQRILRELDGTVKARSLTNAAGDIASNLALPSARSLIAGGAIPSGDSLATVPSIATVSYPTGGPTEVLLSGGTGGAFSGPNAATKVFHDTAYYDGTTAQLAVLQALTNRIAQDYGLASAVQGDWKFAGIVPWAPDSVSDAILWSITKEEGRPEVSTKVVPQQFNDLTEELMHSGGTLLPSPPGCPPLQTIETDMRCESPGSPGFGTGIIGHNVNNVYERIVNFIWQNGCYVRDPGAWYLVRQAGCCDCGNSPSAGCCFCLTYTFALSGLSPGCSGNDNFTLPFTGPGCVWRGVGATQGAIATLTMGDSVGSVAQLQIVTSGGCTAIYAGTASNCSTFTVTLISSTGTGWPGTLTMNCQAIPTFGSTGSCIPGTCSFCTNPPYQWTVPVSGFTGACAVFNGTWTLAYTSACVWSLSAQVGGSTVTITLAMSATTWGLSFFSTSLSPGSPESSTTIAALYQATPGNCCAATTFIAVPGNCDCGNDYNLEIPPTVVFIAFPTDPCACLNGPFNIERADMIDGSWVLQGTVCGGHDRNTVVTWTPFENPAQNVLTLNCDNITVINGESPDAGSSESPLYWSHGGVGWTMPVPCCGPAIGDLSAVAITPGGYLPATCPQVLTASPVCCNNVPPCIPGNCSACSNPPATWSIPANSFPGTGIPANSPLQAAWTLYPLGRSSIAACTWGASQVGPDGNTYTVTLILSASDILLTFAWSGPGYAFDINYSVAFSGTNCCNQKTLAYVSDNTGYSLGSTSVAVTPACCSTGTGGSGGSGGNGNPINSSCCPAGNMPNNLTANLTVTSGTCTALNGATVPLSYSSSGTWSGSKLIGGCLITINLSCLTSLWTLTIAGQFGSGSGGGATIISCGLVNDIRFSGTINGGIPGCCMGAIGLNVDINN